jgi:alanine racemase
MSNDQDTPRDRVWVEVDLDNLAHNIRRLKNKVGPEVKLLPLLKANAYGCGIGVVGKTALENGADWLGVEMVEEGLDLRRASITAPILVVGPVACWQADAIVTNDLRVTLRDEDTLTAIQSVANKYGKVVLVHIELDTGLHRLGLSADEAFGLIQKFQKKTSIKLEGVWTHFTSSDEVVPDLTRQQFEQYQGFLKRLKDAGIEVPIQHAANSAALIQYPEMRLNMARCGETVYGLVPRRDLHQSVGLLPVVEWKTRLIRIQSCATGITVGYGQTWMAKRDSLIGTITVGYADGYRRSFSNCAHVLIRGHIAPVAGKTSMQMTMVDLTDVPEAAIGDEVVLIGQQGNRCITAYDLADWAGTGEFEILVNISVRVPRHYVHHES